MAVLVAEVRSVYYRTLLAVLFPFVFVATLLEDLPREWGEGLMRGFLLAFAVFSTMAIGIAAVYALKNLF